MWLEILLSILLVFVIHLWITYPYNHWKNKGVPYPKPTPLVGNIGKSLIFTETLGETYWKIYNDFKDCLYVGIYKLRSPAILLRDPEIVKDVLIKNFNSFHDNDIEVTENDDEIMGRNPFCLRGNKWKIVRGQVTANITTGKIKIMFYLMTNVGKNLVEYLKKNQEAKGPDGLEAKELAAKYTTDVVAACAFGLEGKSFVDPNAEFRTMGRKFMQPNLWNAIKIMILFVCPKLSAIMKVSFVSKNIVNWFKEKIMETIRYRKENNIVRNDYLDMMLALKDKPGEYEFTDIDVVAQAMTFYVDGFETSSITLSFAFYEIAKHPEIQEKLRKEIDSILEKHGGDITYDAIQEMTYLDMVLNETLRKYPPGAHIVKLCTQAHTFPPARPDGPELDIPVGASIIVPILAIHRDPEFYPDPDVFDPERFSEDRKGSIPKCAYLPFGEGPRQCLGYRFAVAQVKAGIISVVKNFDIKVNSKTKEPLEFNPKFFMLGVKGGLWLNFLKREN